jgi:hypothetical protein
MLLLYAPRAEEKSVLLIVGHLAQIAAALALQAMFAVVAVLDLG